METVYLFKTPMKEYQNLLLSRIEIEIDSIKEDIEEGYHTIYPEVINQNKSYVHGLIDALQITGYDVRDLVSKLNNI